MKKKIGILTGGGDCPGLNAVIRAVAKKLILEQGAEIIGIKDGYEGLVRNNYRKLSYQDVCGILTLGGTILGTSNVANPYRYACKKGDKTEMKDISQKVLKNIKSLNIDGLVCIGGDGTLAIAYQLYKDGAPIVGVPKTIDNDIRGTDITFGFNSAVTIATEGIDRIHTTAQSHHRIMIIELMGRNAGWIALHAGIAGGGDIILLPEIPYGLDVIAAVVKERYKRGKRFSIIVLSEGSKPKGGSVVVQRFVKESTIQARLGGVGFMLGEQLEKYTGLETRTVVMGHLQRGGSPTAFDRILATQLGTKAALMIEKGEFGYMAAVKGNKLVSVSLEKVAKGPKTVAEKHPLICSALSIGTSFGS
ncbi:MAG: ATP-dependent 6-phosphofructokinase [Candidatus Omnitrophica bacterium]|nr:ATP-dependent 6-phosphofructokinase [Candidatus Omnitrophota bacterium]